MLKLLGSVLVVVSTGALGFGGINRMKQEVRVLRSFVGALEGMEREISFQLTPMPALFWGLSVRMEEPLGSFFATLSEKLDRSEPCALGTLWREGLAQISLSPSVSTILNGLGDVLGRYDGENQCHAIARAREELMEILQTLEVQRVQKSKMYVTLSLTAGILLVILLN